MRLTPITLALGVALTVALPSAALAWDAEGHRIIAAVAYERLDPKARAGIAALIARAPDQDTPQCPVQSLEDAAVWPDCARGMRGRFSYLSPMHYEDVALCGSEPKAVVCPDGACVVDEIRRALAILRDSRRSAVERLQALEEVAHFVGDLHQPLHAADNHDRGGNSTRVEVEGRLTNLHHVWDTEAVEHAVGRSETAAVAQIELLVRRNGAAWSAGDPDAWLAESHRLAVAYAYGKLPQQAACGAPAPDQTIPTSYLDAAAPVVRKQLGRAGVRLALVLNQALG